MLAESGMTTWPSQAGSSEREPAVSLGVKHERHWRLAPVADRFR